MLKQVLTKLWEMGKRQEDEGKKESKEEENANVIESDFKEQIEESGDQDTSSSKKKDKNKKTHSKSQQAATLLNQMLTRHGNQLFT